jgi:hypothetical protein
MNRNLGQVQFVQFHPVIVIFPVLLGGWSLTERRWPCGGILTKMRMSRLLPFLGSSIAVLLLSAITVCQWYWSILGLRLKVFLLLPLQDLEQIGIQHPPSVVVAKEILIVVVRHGSSRPLTDKKKKLL